MNKEEVETKKKLIQKRNIIKQKLQELKEGELIQEQSLTPITKHLKTIADTLNGEVYIKSEPVEEYAETFSKFSSPKRRKIERKSWKASNTPSFLQTPVVAEGASKDSDENDNCSDDNLEQSVQEAKEYIQDLADSPTTLSHLEKFDPLPRDYVHKMISDVNNEFDFKYGVRYDPEYNELKIGNSSLQLDGKDLVIGGLTYKGTPGLYELLFKKRPKGFKESDRHSYLDIVKRTNAHRRNYSDEGQIQGNGSYKYTNIISALSIQPLAPRKPRNIKPSGRKLGYGMLMETSTNPIDYVHWNDPNELVDRLRILVASQTSGHTGHTNEIVSIIEELRESRIIE